MREAFLAGYAEAFPRYSALRSGVPKRCFSPPYAGDACKRAFQASRELLRLPSRLETMPSPGSNAEQARPPRTAAEAGHSSGR
jgi:hypothetical protein